MPGPKSRRPVNAQISNKPREKAFWGIKKLVSYAKGSLPWILLALLLASAGAVLLILGPSRITDITTLIQEGIMTGQMHLAKIGEIALTLMLFYILSILFSYLQSLIMTLISNKMSEKLRNDLAKKINRVPLKTIEGGEAGDVMSLISNDVDLISQSLGGSLANLISSFVQLIGITISMFISDYRLAFTVIGATLIGMVLSFVILFKSQPYFTKQQVAVAAVNGHIEEIYGAHAIVRANCAEKTNEKAFDKLSDELFEMNWKSNFFGSIMMPLMNFMGNFGYVAVCVVGAILVLNGDIEIAVISGFLLSVRLFTNPLSNIAQSIPSIQQTDAASERVFHFLDKEEVSDESKLAKHLLPSEVKGAIEFSHVRFGYEENKPIIHDFSVSVKPGQKVAIVGPTGAGKTTLVNLLMRFYEIWDGSISIDGINTKELPREEVHALFGMVLQDTWLFEGTIRENLKFNHPEIPDKIMKGDAKICGVDHFIRALPHGYHTILDDHLEISAGQKQLLTITRAMIQNAPMLILDEATSSVDTRTEIVIQKAMDELTKGRTSFIIAHRLSTIKNADLILVLKDGNVVESGTHDSLLKANGFYADLYNSQFKNAEE